MSGKNYIDKSGVPHGDWIKIIAEKLQRWNERTDRERDELNLEGGEE